MHLRQILTNPDFLNALNKANTDEARISELKRLNDHAKHLAENIKALPEAERFDVDFNPIRVFFDSQYVISCLNDLVEKIKQSDNLTDGEIAELIHELFNNRNDEAKKIRNDYCPGLPKDTETDAHKLLWKLAELCGKHWDLDPIKILIPTLKVAKLSSDQTICKDHKIILNEARTFPISITTFLNRLARNEGFTYYDPVIGKTVNLTNSEKLRLVYTLTQFSNPHGLRPTQNGGEIITTMLSKLRKECAELLNNDADFRHDYYDLDKEHYYHILAKSWILKDPVKFFDFMGYLPSTDWTPFVNAIFANHSIEEINKHILQGHSFTGAVKNLAYYTKDRNHNAAVLFFFAELYSQNRILLPEFENGFLKVMNYVIPTNVLEYLAFSRRNKHPSIVTLQAYLVTDKEISKHKMRGYFIDKGQEYNLKPLCEANSKSGAIVDQIEALGLLYAPAVSPVKQGIFADVNKLPINPEETPVNSETSKIAAKMS